MPAARMLWSVTGAPVEPAAFTSSGYKSLCRFLQTNFRERMKAGV
jgi:hypothetical protein